MIQSHLSRTPLVMRHKLTQAARIMGRNFMEGSYEKGLNNYFDRLDPILGSINEINSPIPSHTEKTNVRENFFEQPSQPSSVKTSHSNLFSISKPLVSTPHQSLAPAFLLFSLSDHKPLHFNSEAPKEVVVETSSFPTPQFKNSKKEVNFSVDEGWIILCIFGVVFFIFLKLIIRH